MDKEYIEREALLSHLFSKQDEPLDVMKEIAAFPAADVVEAVHGRWIKHEGYTECSECGHWYDSPESEYTGDRSNYCPNCGAKMDGEENTP